MPIPTREKLLPLPLSDLAAYWLDLRCGDACGRVAQWPFKLLSQSYPAASLETVLPKFRCETCGQPPRTATVKQIILSTGGKGFTSGGWEVRVLP